MALQILIAVILAFIVEIIGTAILVRRLQSSVDWLEAYIKAVDELQEVMRERLNALSETEDNLVEAQQSALDRSNILLLVLRIVVNYIVKHEKHHSGGADPPEDCWSPDENNFDSYDDERQWDEYRKEHPNATRCTDN